MLETNERINVLKMERIRKISLCLSIRLTFLGSSFIIMIYYYH